MIHCTQGNSPNFGPRKGGGPIDLIVLHYTAMPTTQQALERLCDPQHQVSAHYLISRQGQIWRLVDEQHRAWHAGAGAWGGVTDVNSRSIGIELANTGTQPFSEPQMAFLERLLADISVRHAIRPERIIGHSDMAPDRKADPGKRFDWRRLAKQGLSVWPDAISADVDIAKFKDSLLAFGYPDVPLEYLIAAFRLRFRPFASGPLDRQDMGMALDLAVRFSVDPARGST